MNVSEQYSRLAPPGLTVHVQLQQLCGVQQMYLNLGPSTQTPASISARVVYL